MAANHADPIGITPDRIYTMYGIQCVTLGTLNRPTDPDIQDIIEVLYRRFFLADTSHDIIQTQNARFIGINANYRRCINKLFPTDLPNDPENVEKSEFKEYVTGECERVITAAAVTSGILPMQQQMAPINVPRFMVIGQMQVLFPEGGQQALVNIQSQHVDNFLCTEHHIGFGLNVLVTPGRLFDMACRSPVNSVLAKLLEWWLIAGGIGTDGRPKPFAINLVERGITTIANSYVFIGIETTPVDAERNAENTLLVFVIQLGETRKIIKFKLREDGQNNPVVPTPDGTNLLVSYGKNLARCFFYEIYGSQVTSQSLRKVSCLQKKSVQKKIPMNTNSLKKLKFKGHSVGKTVMKGGVPKKGVPKKGPNILNENLIVNESELLQLFGNDHDIMGMFLILSKFLGDWLIMATTPYDTSAVSTNDSLLCANNIINFKKTLFSYCLGGVSYMIYFEPSIDKIRNINTGTDAAVSARAAAAAALLRAGNIIAVTSADAAAAAAAATTAAAAAAAAAVVALRIPAVAAAVAAEAEAEAQAAKSKVEAQIKAQAATAADRKSAANERSKGRSYVRIATVKKVVKGLYSITTRAVNIRNALETVKMMKTNTNKREALINATQKIKNIYSQQQQQRGGAFLKYVVREEDLGKYPPQVINGNEKIIAFFFKGKKLNINEELGKQGIVINDTINIVTSDTVLNDASKSDDNHNSINKAYFLFTASFKGMLKEFTDNLTNVFLKSTHIKIESGDPVGYNIADAPRFRERLSKVIGFYTVIYDIPDDELLKTLMQTNIFRALELITPISPFIPVKGTNEFVFLSCPNWSTSIFHAEQYLGKFLTNPETRNIEKYVGEDKNLHTAFIKELNSNLSLKKETPIPIVSSREEPRINNFEDFLKKIVLVIAPYIKDHTAFYEEFGVSVAHMRELLGIDISVINVQPSDITPPPLFPPDFFSPIKEGEEEEEGEVEEEEEEEGEGQHEKIYEHEEKSLKIKKICNRIPQILSTLIACGILRETLELEVLKALIFDSEENPYLIKSIHQLLKKTINYYGTFICVPDIIVSFVEGIDFQSNTLLFFGDYLQLYEYINIYGETKTELVGNNTYNNIETYLPLQEIYYITEEVLELPDVESITDKQNLDERQIDEIIQKSVNQVMQQLEQPQSEQQPEQQFNPLELQHVVPEGEAVTVGTGGKNNHKSKHNAKYRKKYKKFVSKYIIKKKKNKNKNKSRYNNKNKTKKNKKIAKNKSKYAKKTLKNKNKNKNKKRNNKSNHKSKHNKKANTNYYNRYKHNKTLKH